MIASRAPRSGRPQVALIVETSLASGRDILLGIARYIHEQGPWSVYHEPRGVEQVLPRWLKSWEGDGIIARVQNHRVAADLARSGQPVVDVLGVVEDTGLPLVHVDDAAIGQRGAEHLLERGFRHFGFVSFEQENWSLFRARAFAERVAAAGFSSVHLSLPRRTVRSGSWDRYTETLARWVADLPRPAGVMIASDQLGRDLLEACRQAELHVPEDVGVLGVDNDEPLCLVANPPLSSLWPNHARVGYEAARLLHQLMEGARPPTRPLYLPPGNVIARVSTNTLAVDDRVVATAARFIREHACAGISVEDVVRQVPVCRSILQRRFRAVFQRTVHDEIILVRLRRAQELLRETDLSLSVIAEKAGFRHQEYMGVVFRARLGLTPARYRQEARRDDG